MEGGSRYVAGRAFASVALRGAACRVGIHRTAGRASGSNGADDRGATGLKNIASSIMAAIVIACLPMTDARACMGSELWQTIFFEPDDLAKGVDAPVAADVTIVAASMLPRNRLVLTAHVNKMIRGKVEGGDITIAHSPSNCDDEIRVGMRGIVAGQMSRDARVKPEFIAIFETREDRERRRGAVGMTLHAPATGRDPRFSAGLNGAVIGQFQYDAQDGPRLLAQTESRPNPQQESSAQPKMRYLAAFLDRPPTAEERATVPSFARDVFTAKVRVRKLVYLIGRHQRRESLPKDRFIAAVEVVEVLEGRVTVGAKYDVYFGPTDVTDTYIFPRAEERGSREYFIVSFTSSDNRRRLLELPRPQQEYDTWLMESAQMKR